MSPSNDCTLGTDAPSRLGLGTVQWGMPYGVSNARGIVPVRSEVVRILSDALEVGVQVLDTAPVYGAAEELLGQVGARPFRVVTKVPRLQGSSAHELGGAIRASISKSREQMRCDRLAGVLLHHAKDLIGPQGAEVARALREAKADGLVERIGFSAYDPQTVRRACEVLQPDIVQVPLSVLDQRMALSGCLSYLKAMGTEVHVRSVFLQGLLLMSNDDLPPGLAHLKGRLTVWQRAVAMSGLTPMEAALAFVRAVPDVDVVLVGTCTYSQYQEVKAAFFSDCWFDGAALSLSDRDLIDPSTWSTH